MKYRNKITYVDGIRFASQKEAEYYLILREYERAELITNLQLQTVMPFVLDNEVMFKYRPDFEYDAQDGHHIVDVKGVLTPVFKLKKKLIEKQYGCKIELR